MLAFTKHDKHVVDLYKKAMAINLQNQQDSEFSQEEEAMKDLDDHFWEYLNGRLRMLVMSVSKMKEMPSISKAKIDQSERDVSDLLTMVQMYCDPYVINQLMNEALAKNLKEKMLKRIKSE